MRNIDLNKLCFLPGSLLPLKDGKYPYIQLLKQGLDNLGVVYPSSGGGGIESIVPGTNITVDDADPLNPIVSASGGGGVPSLTATQIAFGDGSNEMTSSSNMLYDDSNIKISMGDLDGNGSRTKMIIDDSNSSIIISANSAGIELNNNTQKSRIGDINSVIGDNVIEIDTQFNTFNFIVSSINQISIADQTLTIGEVGINASHPYIKLQQGIAKPYISLKNIPTYTDNSQATIDGYPVDGIYKTATGELRIVV